MKIYNALLVILIILVSGCVQQEEIKEITIPGHGSQIYEFSYDVRESIRVRSSGEDSISALLRSADKIGIIFNGTSKEDNGYFSAVAFNILAKLQTFYAYEGKLLSDIAVFYYDEGWHNKTGTAVEKPDLTGASIWLLGPHTGANGTSVSIDGSVIYVQGTSLKNIAMAGDKLALIAMGISSADQITPA